MSLRNKLIRLAYTRPDLRDELLPLLGQTPRGKTAGALRIFEYMGDDGVMFWSFTKLSHMEMRRLYLTEPRGNHYRSHISDIHRLAHVDPSDSLDEGPILQRPRYGGSSNPPKDGDGS